MLGQKDDNNFNTTVPPPPLPPAAAGGGNRKTFFRSVSCLPPISVSRPKATKWPEPGTDDIAVWRNVITTPQSNVKPGFEFDKECSRIMDHVFLGSDSVAKNRDVLRVNGITHVLNCVGFVCPEYFKKDLVYKTLWLRDTPNEDITSILYDVFDYFEDVREQNGRIFVHCRNGISRSTSLVIAYLMWINRVSFEEAFKQVKTTRTVIDPNMGFARQLLSCQKRVHAGPVNSGSPGGSLRMFRIAPHSSYDPLHLVPKLLARPDSNALDSRGAFIVHVFDNIYVWVGKNCVMLMCESAVLAASQVVKYEKVNGPVFRVLEGEEPVEFWGAGLSENEAGLGEKRVVDYDIDFEIFDKAVNGGVVPPALAVSSGDNNYHEMRLPARQSGWQRFKRKFNNCVMKELMDYKESYEHELCESSSFSVKRFKKVH